jgi:hypothetical protein
MPSRLQSDIPVPCSGSPAALSKFRFADLGASGAHSMPGPEAAPGANSEAVTRRREFR